jgi:nucleotidyltransferase/DNA polymerase involved in DNA repair
MYRGRLIPGNFSDGAQTNPRSACWKTASTNPASPVVTNGAWGGEKRIACVLVADFAVAAITRANPELRDRPFALIRMPTAQSHTGWKPVPLAMNNSSGPVRKPAGYQPHSELSHVSPSARAAGLRPAMTVAQARALIPDLIVTRPSSAAERSAADALLDVAESISPVTEEGAPGCVWLDLTGVERLYRYSMGAEGTADDVENSLAQELIRRARRISLEAAAGIGSNKEIAHLAARCGGARVIAAGMEREFLDWLPLDLLELDPNGRGDEIELMLKRLGISRLGDIARLDSRAVGSRLGRHGVQLARLARGEGSATVIARPRAETFAEAVEFEYGIENLEPLGFVLHAMLKQLTERLQIRGLAAGDLKLSLGLAGRGHDSRHVAVAAATTEARSLLTLLKLHLEKSPPPAAVETVRLTVEARARRPAQNDLFLPAAPAPDRLEAAIARIAALCGPERVGTLVPADSYRPEAVRLSKFAPPPPLPATRSRTAESAESRLSQYPAAPASDSTPIVLRAIRPAEEVEVMCTRNSPEFVRGNNICARVVSSAGPWRRQGEWWAAAQSSKDSAACAMPNNSPAAYNRDYYELALADGAVYRIYRDLSSGRWFADGIYD